MNEENTQNDIEPVEPVEPDVSIPEVIPPKSEEVQPSIVGIDDDVKNLLLQAVNMNTDSLVHEPTCVICRSAARSEAEQQWLETKDTKDVKKIIKDQEGTTVTNAAIKHHMLAHLNRENNEFYMLEYANRIQRMGTHYLSTLDRLNMQISILDDRLMHLNALSPSNDFSQAEVEKLQGDLTVKIMTSMHQLLKLKASIEKDMQSKGDVVTIPTSKFIEVFNTAIADARSQEAKDAIYDIIKRLQAVSQGNG